MKKLCIVGLLFTAFIAMGLSPARAGWEARIRQMAKEGAVYAVGQKGGVLFEHHADKPLIPASIIKLITASAAFHYLGPAYRFPTDFFLDKAGNLYIKGYGDPMLISEEWEDIARSLAGKGLQSVNSIFIDDSYFSANIEVPGRSDALDPYNAPVNALSANFNTISVHVHPDGSMTSQEPQTPMTDFAMNAARLMNLRGAAFVNLGQKGIKYQLYPGHLLRAFLESSGIPVSGDIGRKIVPSDLNLFYRHLCRYRLEDVVHKMLKYSNNFTANQIFLTLGARVLGDPATLEKGQRAISGFLARSLGVKNAKVVEGSGLSRMNHVTARQMDRVLKYFWPHRRLLPTRNGMKVKTGTLSDVKSSAGYLNSSRHGRVRLVVIINNCRSYRPKHRIIDMLKRKL